MNEMEYTRYSSVKQSQSGYVKTPTFMIRMLGTNEALILSQIESWCMTNAKNNKVKTHFHEDRFWMYKTFEDWADEFAISVATAKRAMQRLRDLGIVDVRKFNTDYLKRFNWYSVNDKVLDLCIASWYINGNPSNISSKLHNEFTDFHKYLMGGLGSKIEDDKIDELIEELEQIVRKYQNDTMGKKELEQIFHECQNDTLLRTCQNDTLLPTEAITVANNFPAEKISKKIEEKSIEKNKTIKDNLQSDFLLSSIEETKEIDLKDSGLVKWIMGKNNCGVTKIRSLAKPLEEKKKYDSSGKMLSAIELYEDDIVYQQWCSHIYGERHKHYTDKDGSGVKPLGTEKTIEMVTDAPIFFAWQDEKRGAIEYNATEIDIDDMDEYDQQQMLGDPDLDLSDEEYEAKYGSK